MKGKRWQIVAVLGVMLLGAILRLWHLGDKPLWLDEILTALFSLGQDGQQIPLDRFVSIAEVRSHFVLNPTATCGDIARTLAVESTHPPFFFCLIHQTLQGFAALPGNWQPSLAQQVRSLPVCFGILSITAVYWLDRLSFSHRAGLLAAAWMAVSPFAVYLSQEARHYTLPLLLVTLSLGALVRWVRDWMQGRSLLWGTRGVWVAANALGLYVHYFVAIAYIAQSATLVSVLLWQSLHPKDPKNLVKSISKRRLLLDLGVLTLPGVLFLPWLPILSQHFNRPETDWFQPFEPSWTDGFAPIGQTLASWVVMVVAFPVENQPLWRTIPLAVAMLLCFSWVVRRTWGGLRDRWRQDDGRLELLTLASFTGWVLLAFVAIVYGLGKDITTAPRYHFIYFPAVCALLGAAMSPGDRLQPSDKVTGGMLLAGLLSAACVANGLVFYKPYYPRQVAQTLSGDATVPVEVVVGYENSQEIALGLSFALELPPQTQFALLDRSSGYAATWPSLATQPPHFNPPFDVWVVAPGLRQAEYPPRLWRGNWACDRDDSRYYRLGIPYQAYRCTSPK